MFKSFSLLFATLLAATIHETQCFSMTPTTRTNRIRIAPTKTNKTTKTAAAAAAAAVAGTSSSLHAYLNLELEKPLGIILEEMEEGGSEGVKVEELSDAGSAYASQYRDQLVGLKIAKVMDNDVTSKFSDVCSPYESIRVQSV